MARAVHAEWHVVGSELEALVREARLILELQPSVNVQTRTVVETREIPAALMRDVIVVAPSVEEDSVELIAARADGIVMIQRTRRTGADLGVHATRLRKFFRAPLAAAGVETAAIVFSWLAGRGASATRLDPHDSPTRRHLAGRLSALLADDQLFRERIDQRRA
jgi:hypothetical protein